VFSDRKVGVTEAQLKRMEVAETMPPTATILTSPEGIKVVIFGSTHISFTSVSLMITPLSFPYSFTSKSAG
jgi:hypothetical protein